MLLAKKQVEEKPHKSEMIEYQSSSTTRMAGTAKAMIPPGIKKQSNFKSERDGDQVTVNRKKGKQLIVPDEIKEA